ncbi:MAG: DNA-binding transcriptional regulator [Chthoniobacteraceae bacterium]
MRKPPPRRIAIVYPATVTWMARFLHGIRRYAASEGGWHLFTSPPTLDTAGESALTFRSMRGWKGDAMIAMSNDEQELREIRRSGMPTVNLAAGLKKSHGVPRVMVNHFLAGQMAADHLLERGLRHLAFFGWKGQWYSEQRQAGFAKRAAESGATCEAFLQASREESNRSWPERIAGVAEWLLSLPRPTGIFAVQDYRALLLIEACQEAELRIPDDIAVIGMDNDETVCEHCTPTLTSVSRNSDRVGWEVAALLDRMMRGESAPMEDLLLEPDGVVARQSTDMLYCAEPVVQLALDFMRAKLHEQFNIEQLAEHAGVSKRTLETRFRESLHTSPHDFLTKLRVQHAQALMQLPQKRTIEETALECGFGTAPAFYAAFRRIVGESPGTYRKRQLARHAPQGID